MRTMKELAKEALAVQDACNPMGVVNGFQKAMTDLRQVLIDSGKYDGDSLAAHPIYRLWVYKLADLAGMDPCGSGEGVYSNAVAWCTDLLYPPAK